MNWSEIPAGHFEARYYETYYFANVVGNILEDPIPYIRRVHEFYEDDNAFELTIPYPKYSHFHRFIEFVISDLIFERLSDFNLEKAQRREKNKGSQSCVSMNFEKSPLESAFIYHEIKHESFRDWLQIAGTAFEEATEDDIYDYYRETRMSEEYEQLIQAMVEETFFVMFLNRKVMRDFNRAMEYPISELRLIEIPEEYRKHLRKDGVLERAHIPTWAKKAVFFRERGKCALSRQDLSGLLSVLNEAHFDHIVPLSAGGLNDVTNLQLLAANINLEKADKNDETSLLYERWYW